MDNWNTINSIINQTAYIREIASAIYTPEVVQVQEAVTIARGCYNSIEALIQPQNFLNAYFDVAGQFNAIENIELIQNISNTLQSLNIGAMYVANLSLSENDEEIDYEDVKQANEKIVTEILLPDSKKCIDTESSAIIKLSPINDNVLRYLAENPQALYNLSGGDFEDVMAKIYSKLGYDVERTKATRDGGKDLIIRKSEILGDFVYYVECKKYATDRPIGVGIVKNFACTINEDGVNGGILATTSFFTSGAIKHIKDYKYGYRIQMHDYNTVRALLNNIV